MCLADRFLDVVGRGDGARFIARLGETLGKGLAIRALLVAVRAGVAFDQILNGSSSPAWAKSSEP